MASTISLALKLPQVAMAVVKVMVAVVLKANPKVAAKAIMAKVTDTMAKVMAVPKANPKVLTKATMAKVMAVLKANPKSLPKLSPPKLLPKTNRKLVPRVVRRVNPKANTAANTITSILPTLQPKAMTPKLNATDTTTNMAMANGMAVTTTTTPMLNKLKVLLKMLKTKSLQTLLPQKLQKLSPLSANIVTTTQRLSLPKLLPLKLPTALLRKKFPHSHPSQTGKQLLTT
jgi:hypothetical protein